MDSLTALDVSCVNNRPDHQLDPPVLFIEQPNRHGGKIGHAILNAERTLNALSLPMIELLDQQLRRWAEDPELILVVLKGAGQRAFCAGGDVVELHRSMIAHPDGPNPYAEAFFSREYRLDHLLHRYPKPLLCWGSGIVMGGGWGLMAGCSHRVVTPDSRLAMPEIRIGLYPDAGASWFLGQLPRQISLFLGLTGAPLNASDARLLGVADHLLSRENQVEVEQRLQQTQWNQESTSNHQHLSALLAEIAGKQSAQPPESATEKHQSLIHETCAATELAAVVEAILELPQHDPWLAGAVKNLREGSMISALLTWHQLREQPPASLAGAFRQELVLSLQCACQHEFTEGVRARLVERDQRPKWRYPSIRALPDRLLESFTEAPWPDGRHPLADLN